MSFALDDIWDEPVEPQPRAQIPSAVPIDIDDHLPGPSPAKRPRTKLFLSDSEDGSPKEPTAPRPGTSSKLNPDINALFDDLEGDNDHGDNGHAAQGLAPSLDLDALRRQAATRHVAGVSALTPREIFPSSSPPRDVEGEEEDGGKGKKGTGEKKRKPLPKLDEARLLGTDGFPALVKQTKSFKPRGKGHEASDLKKLMQIYQFWTHKMYPRNHFRENVQRIEKLCHSKRMTVAMSVWRDESKGLVNGRKHTDDPPDIPSDDEQEDGERTNATPPRDSSMSAPGSPTSHRLQPSSPPPRPPSSASERTSGYSDDDIDIDALIQEDAERQAAAVTRRSSPPLNANTTNYRSNSEQVVNLHDMEEDDDALWSSFNDPSVFDDPSLAGGSTSAATSIHSAPGMVDGEEDEWQILREQEEEERARAQKQKQTGAPSNVQMEIPPSRQGQVEQQQHKDDIPPNVQGQVAEPEQRHTGDEGWDEMYL